ncbi:MAG: hypothetical protein ACM3SP_03170 [Chloroflexota bacterium]
MDASSRLWPRLGIVATLLARAGAPSAHVGRSDATLVEEVLRERR